MSTVSPPWLVLQNKPLSEVENIPPLRSSLGFALASRALGRGPASSPDASKWSCPASSPFPSDQGPPSPLLLPDFGDAWTVLSVCALPSYPRTPL